jgi:hypothetical protein
MFKPQCKCITDHTACCTTQANEEKVFKHCGGCKGLGVNYN